MTARVRLARVCLPTIFIKTSTWWTTINPLFLLSDGPTEAIHLITAEASDTVDSEEHELATGCPKEGKVKFTVALGVRSGYQLLMMPVVYTVKETESMNHDQDVVTEDHSTLVAQPSPLEAKMGGGRGEGSEFSSISNPT